MAYRKYWVGFSKVTGIGPGKLRILLERFGDLESAWFATSKELNAAGLDGKTADNFIDQRSRLQLDVEMAKLEKLNVQALTWEDRSYPARLKEIYAPPPVLYIRGAIIPEDEVSVGVVGTRKATVYGRDVTYRMVRDLVAHGVTVISGLAKGIDTTAHRLAIENGGRTIAVLGCGVDIVYPPENANLASAIVDNGALVSEYPLGTKPDAKNFPPRNRIISGLSLGTLVTEAGERSGAQITASFALEQNREVFAVPGNVNSPASRGTNRLIQQGAKLVLEVSDMLEELNLVTIDRQMEMREFVPDDENEALLLRCLSAEATHIDEIRRDSGLPIAVVSATLAMMELKNIVRQVGNMTYVSNK